MQNLRETSFCTEKIWYMSYLFQRAGVQGRNSWRKKSQLVVVISAKAVYYRTVQEKGEAVMAMTDPIADMLTRIRNANIAGHETVDIPASKMKKAIAGILLEEGYIKGYDVVDDSKQGIIKVQMKYGTGKEKVISGIKKISKPGLKVYAKVNEVPRVLGGLGIAIISTSKGVMSDKKARELGVGGEVVCYVW